MAINSLGSVGSPSVAPNVAPTPGAPAQAPAAAVSQQAPPSKQMVEKAVAEIKQAMASMSATDLNFTIDGDTRQTVVKVIDSQTGDIIRQIPAQEVIDIARAMDQAKGLLLRQQA